MPSKTECLVQAIGHVHGAFTPETSAFDLCNPLMIKSFARPGKHATSPEGVRIFPSILDGIKAGVYDMALKVSGKSRAGLKPTDLLSNLFRVYGLSHLAAQDKAVSFLRRALKDQSISKDTELSYFLETECPK